MPLLKRNIGKTILHLAVVIGLLLQSANCQLDGTLSLQQRCERYGFGYEEYQLTTEDGYIITLMRIPSGPDSPPADGKTPIFFIHALATEAGGFAMNGPDASPAFNLANQGYDVWLNNFRGSDPSRGHVSLDSVMDPEYWDFDTVSLRLDLMADITFILEQTGFSSINAFAYSMGGTALAWGMAIEPEFFETRLELAMLAATPVSYANNNSILYSVLGNFPYILDILDGMNLEPMLAPNGPMNQILSFPCVILPQFCSLVLGFGAGMANPVTDNPTSMGNAVISLNLGTSFRNLQHFVQSSGSGSVTYYDFGPDRNLIEYGTETPPPIPLENTNNRIALLYSGEDTGSDPVDAQWYADLMGDNIVFFQFYDISHLGFVVGDTEEYLADVVNLMETYPPQAN